MARSMPDVGDRLQVTPAFDFNASGSGSVSIWFKPNWNSGDSVVHRVWWLSKLSGTVGYMGYQKYSDNNVYVGFEGNGLGSQRIVVADTGLFASGVWANHVFTWSDAADDCRYYVAGVEVGSRTSALTTFALDSELALGNTASSVDDNACDGTIAEAGFWDAQLTSAEAVSLAKAYSPKTVRPGALLEYWDLVRSLNGAVSGHSLTDAGTAIADHPRVIYPRRKQVVVASAAAPAGDAVPQVWSQYRRRHAG